MTTSMLPDVGIELREGYAEVGDVRLHYVEAGDGPLIVLLHGFPEFWFGWRLQIEPLTAWYGATCAEGSPCCSARSDRRTLELESPTYGGHHDHHQPAP